MALDQKKSESRNIESKKLKGEYNFLRLKKKTRLRSHIKKENCQILVNQFMFQKKD